MLYKSAYISWDFTNIWTIEEGNTTAYLKNVQKPSGVNKENITYDAYAIVGEGTEVNPYIITTPLQLQKLNENLESYYKLGANIDLSGRTWKQIGSETYPFKGQLDGDGYTISNLSIETIGNNVGLFGYSSGKLKSIKLDNIHVKGTDNVGGLVGYSTGIVDGCELNNIYVEANSKVGGLVGYNAGTINNCVLTNITTKGTDNVGGLVGHSIGNITNSTVQGTVTNTGDNTGGLARVYNRNNN